MVINNVKSKIKLSYVDIIIYFLVGFAAFITVWPFIYVFSMSISDPLEAAKQTIWLYPKGFSLEAYIRIFYNSDLWNAYKNTLFYTIAGTILNLLTASISAYPLSRKRLFARKFFIMFLIIPMYFSGGLIPHFILIDKLHMYNTVWVMIIPGMLSIWNIILTRTYFKTIPDSLQESALIDGANDLQILFRIIIPLSKPIMAVVALYTAVGIWNSWFNAMIYLPNPKLQPLQLFLTKVLIFEMASLNSSNSGAKITQFLEQSKSMAVAIQLKYAAIMFCSLPIICFYPFLQKYFIKGALIGSLKE